MIGHIMNLAQISFHNYQENQLKLTILLTGYVPYIQIVKDLL